MDGERETIPFLKEILAEEKEQPMMCEHPFQHPIESALGFRWYCLQASRSFLVYNCYRRMK